MEDRAALPAVIRFSIGQQVLRIPAQTHLRFAQRVAVRDSWQVALEVLVGQQHRVSVLPNTQEESVAPVTPMIRLAVVAAQRAIMV
jgi:hypothetical protein